MLDPSSGRILAGAHGRRALLDTRAAILAGDPPVHAAAATTIGVVATDVKLTKAQAQKMAQMAHDGLARTINPIHTMLDGDTIFALGTGVSDKAANVMLLGVLAAEATALGCSARSGGARDRGLSGGGGFHRVGPAARACASVPQVRGRTRRGRIHAVRIRECAGNPQSDFDDGGFCVSANLFTNCSVY